MSLSHRGREIRESLLGELDQRLLDPVQTPGQVRQPGIEAMFSEVLRRRVLGIALSLYTRDECRSDRRGDDRKERNALHHHNRTHDPSHRILGVTYPYPTVVTVCSAHHMPSQMVEYARWSRTRIATPLATTSRNVVPTITLAALRTDTGSRRNRSIRRSIGFTRGTLGIRRTLPSLMRRNRGLNPHLGMVELSF
jgi:hypothetical protein